MPTTIIVPKYGQGGTLSEIAAKHGVSVAELQKANNIANPDQIKEGASLIIPEKTTDSGDLNNTLGGEKSIPETPADNLSVFRGLLKTVSIKAGQEATSNGLKDSGIDPSKISGGTLSDVLGFVNRQKTTGVADIYKNTIDFLDNQSKQADDQLKTLITTGGITKLDNTQLKKLADMTDYSLDYLLGIKNSLIDEATAKAQKDNAPTEKEVAANTKATFTDIIKNGTDPDSNGPILGEDGLISPKNWKKLKRQWVEDTNGDAEDFIKNFYIYINPEFADEYGAREAAYID